jgi:hypothetical protein
MPGIEGRFLCAFLTIFCKRNPHTVHLDLFLFFSLLEHMCAFMSISSPNVYSHIEPLFLTSLRAKLPHASSIPIECIRSLRSFRQLLDYRFARFSV